MQLELLHVEPQRRTQATPLLFIHGSFCGAWVWQEHFLPYFAARGFDAYAVSLRGHGASEGELWSASLGDYVNDLAGAVEQVGRPPILIGHSLGGMVVQKYLEKTTAIGAILLASLPPQGLAALTIGMMLRDPMLLQQIYLAETNMLSSIEYSTLRNALFSSSLPESTARNYLRRISGESIRVLADLMSIRVVEPDRIRRNAPIKVIGADNDALISTQITDLTARTYHTKAVILADMAHAAMLDTQWQTAADAVHAGALEFQQLASA